MISQRPNIVTFSPPHAMTLGAAAFQDESSCETIIAINAVALARADFVIANLNGPSFGTPIECMEAPCPVIGFGELARMQKSVYRHRFAYLAADLDEAVRMTLLLIKESEEVGELKW